MKQIDLRDKKAFAILMDACCDVDEPLKVGNEDDNFIIMNPHVYVKMRTKLFEEALRVSSYEEDSRQLGYDPLIPQIMLKGIECGGVNTEMIQKTFLIGYARSARILLQLEDLRYISYDGSDKYKILLSYEDFVRDYINHCLQK